MQPVVSAAARADLKAIARFTERRWTATQAKIYLGSIAKSLAQLARRPKLGRTREEVAPGYRSLPVGRHIIFYRIARDEIIIVRVLHQSMDLRLHL